MAITTRSRKVAEEPDAAVAREDGSKTLKLENKPWRPSFTRLTGDPDYDCAVSVGVIFVFVCLAAENFANTAYGRFGSDTTVGMDPRLGWFLMELPCTLVFAYNFWYIGGPQSHKFVPRLLACIFTMHYMYRGWIFPYMIRVHNGSTNFSIVPAVFSWGVTSTHAYLNARWFSTHGTHLTMKWLKSPFFICGVLMYYSGLYMVVWHDTLQRELRPCPDGERYCIPHGGMYELVTCAHYFAELWAWAGFCLLSCGPNGLFILLISLSNLIPRAAATHRWYVAHFDEYNGLGRLNLFPYLW